MPNKKTVVPDIREMDELEKVLRKLGVRYTMQICANESESKYHSIFVNKTFFWFDSNGKFKGTEGSW